MAMVITAVSVENGCIRLHAEDRDNPSWQANRLIDQLLISNSKEPAVFLACEIEMLLNVKVGGPDAS